MSNFGSDAARERQLLTEQRAAEKKAADERALAQAKQEATYLVSGSKLILYALSGAAAAATLVLKQGAGPLQIAPKF